MKKAKIIVALVLCLVMALGTLSACQNDVVKEHVTYNTTTSTMPSNWNEFTYQDNNDTQIMNYIGSSFFEYDYKFEDGKKYNKDGTVNADAIIDGAFSVNYSAATKLEDVTSTVDAKWGYTDEQKAQGGYAWKITLRKDLKWDDGTAITAEDFEYSMKELLDPEFLNYRANTYYDTLRIKNSRNYFFQNQERTYEKVGDLGYKTNAEAIAAGETLYIDAYEFYNAKGYVDAEGNACPQWVAYDDETVYDTVDAWAAGEAEDAFSGKDLWDNFFAPGAYYGYGEYVEVGADYESWISIGVENLVRHEDWENVGIYAIPEENAIVVCLDKSYSLLTEDGELSVWAAYYMSGLPLVYKAKYEDSKIAPTAGATLWTSNYNSSLATTASWGPYKLTEFEAGSYYKLEKNENWYGWNLEQYKDQYNVDEIYCRKVEEFATKWMGFLNGSYDDASLQSENIGEYANSKYVYYSSTGSGTFGMHLYSNLNKLKASDNNNGILAIQEFRHALNLGLNRTEMVEQLWPGTAIPCFGLVNIAYYYDIENSTTLEDGGRYRNATIAKEGILRAYGFTQGADGKWSTGDLTGLTLDEAYDSLTGYNPTLAKEEMQAAIDILLADPEYYGYDSTKDITIVFGSSVDTDKQRFRCDYLQGIIDGLIEGTALEGKIKLVFDASAGSQWAEAFRDGKTQIGLGYGMSGAVFNPYSLVGAFVDPDDDLNYHGYWDTTAIDLTITLPAGDYEGAGQTITMDVQNWYFCLNGLAEVNNAKATYNFENAPSEAKLTIMSALEELVIKESRAIMIIAESGGSFLGAKFSYISDEENTFMSFGGIRYLRVNYGDDAWAEYVAANNNDLTAEYKKSE